MPLSPRELILLQIRAQDAASGPLQQVGAAAGKLNSIISGGSLRMFAYSQGWARLGQSMTRAGLAITALNVLAFKAAADFGHEMALMQTQAQLTQDQFVRISKDALRVSSTYGVAATDIGRALYDIFSTTRSNSKEAIEMVSGLARASVAGAVDIREATRGVIDIQNAFGEQAGSTTDILNLQFKMLRNSAGTYQELVNAFGSVIGAARQTDQSIQSVSGAIAFLTLRGRSQAEAAISVSRALDLLGRHAKDVRMVLDVNLFDAAGNFRALEDIITDMGTAMQGMTSRERVNAFTEIFGAGSIQANRFFRLAVPQFEALNRSVDELSKKEIAGQLNKAFRAMVRNDPTFILNRIKEQFRNIGITIMTTLAPALKFLADKIQIVFDWFSQLSPKVQKWIGVGAILAGIFLLIGGGVFSLISAVTGLISIFKLAGVSLLG
ncbi:MAG: phage tail tape measure protein, partial [Nitrososphaerales archaeon]